MIVNRLWHHHFGQGLVDTPNDFGFNGGRPSHPELLDWLADELVAERFSLKQLHRAIVLSATYRQAPPNNAAAARLDADNRLLWRKSPRRLEAEAVRDTMLAVAGELNPARGGPGFRDCTEVLRSGSYSYLPGDPDRRRVQSAQHLSHLDARRAERVARRVRLSRPVDHRAAAGVTTTPLQALVLLNNSFVLRMSQAFARARRARGRARTSDGRSRGRISWRTRAIRRPRN